MDKRKQKRENRKHRDKSKPHPSPVVALVFRPKPEHVAEICRRGKSNVGRPFLSLPGNPDQDTVLFTCTDGTPVPVKAVEMVYNDAVLMDFIYDAPRLGPTYRSGCSGRQLEVYEYALLAYGTANQTTPTKETIQ